MARHIGQGLTPGRKFPLRGAAALAIAISIASGTAGFASKRGAQGTEASNGRYPWFNTASIKLNDAPAAEIWASGNKFVAIEPAINMIMFAYGEQHPLKPAQVLGGPDWIKTQVFNIDAELPKSLSDQVKPPLHDIGPPLMYPAEVRRTDAVKQVFRSLLVNRFKLRIRHETKVLPVFDLALAGNGPEIAKDETTDGSCRITDVGPGKGRWMEVQFCDFNMFAGLLSAIPELRSRVLVDKTGLHGRYNFKLHWTPEKPPGMPKPAGDGQIDQNATPSDPYGPSFFTALREELGLKVALGQAPVDVIVIEHIERPTPN